MNPFVIAFRRIIYSIPLKRLLAGLAVFAVLFACFSSADNVSSLVNYIEDKTVTIPGGGYTVLKQLSSSDYGDYCFYVYYNSQSTNGYVRIGFDYRPDALQNGLYASIWQDSLPNTFCMHMNLEYIVASNNYSSSTTIKYKLYRLDTLLNTQLPVYSSMQCQTEYNLIPISSVDQNYCTTNNLCPSEECPDSPDNPNLGTSNIYINDIFHPGAFNVIMNIPEEIDWDYAYTNSGQNFNVDVVGYNQDFEKIEGWINTNNYKPSSEDFTNIFTSGFSNFGGLLVAALFVILVFYFVKKLFK